MPLEGAHSSPRGGRRRWFREAEALPKRRAAAGSDGARVGGSARTRRPHGTHTRDTRAGNSKSSTRFFPRRDRAAKSVG